MEQVKQKQCFFIMSPPSIGTGYGPENAPLPGTANDAFHETRRVIGAMQMIHIGVEWFRKPKSDLQQHGPIDESAILSLEIGTPRIRTALSRWQQQFRAVHRPIVPRFDGAAVTSFFEAAATLAGRHLGYLRSFCREADPDNDEPGSAGQMSERERYKLRAKLISERSQIVANNWPFEQINFEELVVLIELELSWWKERYGKKTDAPQQEIKENEINAVRRILKSSPKLKRSIIKSELKKSAVPMGNDKLAMILDMLRDLGEYEVPQRRRSKES